ncbi:aminotriazole resistance [Pyrenophora seminiperda CCB06]|uniref:Aminotriazole resistance n=1 Tax=Pyrenophora seminiperda CCB06 TaxID=1302712 RepID=A0A3M7LY02_9PLEO|nr:aminotriazole resistance [Pyrenophora seminiperda CCB06]
MPSSSQLSADFVGQSPSVPTMSWTKARTGPLVVLGASVLGGAAYRFTQSTEASDGTLNPHTFTPYTLVDKQPVSATSAIFILRNTSGLPDNESVKEVWKRSIWSVQIKQPQLQIARAYTPLPSAANGKKTGGNEAEDVRLLIRQEVGGEVSTYLHRLPVESAIELRGPHTELTLPRDIIEVIFLAGGTGIAPAMQVAQALARRTGSRMHILWANRRREECIGGISDDTGNAAMQDRVGWWKSFWGSSEPVADMPVADGSDDKAKGVIVKELDALKQHSLPTKGGLDVNYYVDEENIFIQPSDIERMITRKREESGSRLIIVSGPEGFLDYWAGKKLWANGKEVQGPLGGRLSKMNLGEWKVIKLEEEGAESGTALSHTYSSQENPNTRPACFSSTFQECLFVMSVTMAVAMTTFLQGAITTMSSFAARDLHMSTAEVSWMNSGTSLTSGALLLFFGSVADLFGRRSMFIGSMFLFAVVSLGAGFSQNGVTLDILCATLGIFSAAAVPPAQGMLGAAYERPCPRKNYAFGCYAAGSPMGFVFGTILAAAFTQLFSWRACFYLLAITYLLISIVAAFTVPKDTMPKQTLNRVAMKKLDLPGTMLAILGIGMFCAALSLGGNASQGWKTPYVLVLLALGILGIAAFIVWEIKYEHAMIDMTIWLDKDFSLLFIIISFGFLGFPVFNFWIALYFQVEKHMNAIMTGVHLLPMVVCGLTANFTAAVVQHRVSNKLLTGTGAAALVVSFTLAAVQRHGDSYWAFSFPALCLCVIGVDFQFVVANMYVLSSMPLNKQSIAGSLLQTVTRLAMSVGYGIATAIFDAVHKSPATSGYYANDPVQPYAAIFWFAATSAVLGIVLVPFLKVGTQGHEGDVGRVKRRAGSEELQGREVGGERSHGDAGADAGAGYDGGEKGMSIRQGGR